MRGAYHFYRPEVDALAQAQFYLNAVSREAHDLPPAVDLEIHPNISGKFYANPALLRGIQAWVNRVADQTGQKLIIYTNISFTKAFLAVSNGAVPGWLKEHTLWIANYVDGDEPNTHESWTDWKFWQYSKQGHHPGVPKNLVDLDWFNGSLTDLGRLAGVTLQEDAETQVMVEGNVATTLVMDGSTTPMDSQVYVVQAGDTLVSIARQFGVTPGELTRANLQLASAGAVLKTPGGSASVQAGESLKDFAVRLNLNLPDVLRLNPQLIKPGMKLNLPGARPVGGAFIETPVEPIPQAVPAGGSPAQAAAGSGPRPAFTYVIQDGDNLSFIAARFNLSLEELEAANPMQNFDLIFPGQRLKIPAESGS